MICAYIYLANTKNLDNVKFFTDNQKKKLTKNRSELLLQDESPDKDSNGLEDCMDQDNLGEKLSRLSSLTLSSLNSTFQLNKRRADYSTKKKYHSVDSESPTHNYDNVPLPIPFGKEDHPNGARPNSKLIPKKKAALLMVLPAHQPH